MTSVNKAIIVGRVGRDPEIRYNAEGLAIANISIATTDKYKDKATGEIKETTEWHRVSFFGKMVEIVEKYAKKGSLLYIEGKIQTKKWTDKDGVDKYTTSILANSMQLLGDKKADSGNADDDGFSTPPPKPKRQAPQNKSVPQSGGAFDDMDDDVPF